MNEIQRLKLQLEAARESEATHTKARDGRISPVENAKVELRDGERRLLGLVEMLLEGPMGSCNHTQESSYSSLCSIRLEREGGGVGAWRAPQSLFGTHEHLDPRVGSHTLDAGRLRGATVNFPLMDFSKSPDTKEKSLVEVMCCCLDEVMCCSLDLSKGEVPAKI